MTLMYKAGKRCNEKYVDWFARKVLRLECFIIILLSYFACHLIRATLHSFRFFLVVPRAARTTKAAD